MNTFEIISSVTVSMMKFGFRPGFGVYTSGFGFPQSGIRPALKLP